MVLHGNTSVVKWLAAAAHRPAHPVLFIPYLPSRPRRCSMPAVPPPPHHVLRLQISGLEEKKRESIMVVANQTKSRLQLAEDALHRVQVEAEKGQFELAAKKGEQCDWVGGGGEGGVLGGAAVCVQGAGKEFSAASTSWQLPRARGPAAMRLPHLTVPPPAACAHVQGSARPWRVSFRRPRPPWQSCRGSGMSWAPSWAPPKPSCRMCRTAWRLPGGCQGQGSSNVATGWLAGWLLADSGLLLAGGILRCCWLHLPHPPPSLHRHQCSAPLRAPPACPARLLQD